MRLGTIRRDPDIRWRRSEEDMAGFAEAQRAMLANLAGVVGPGGRIVYSTCSSEPEENDNVVDHFLTTTSGFVRVDATTIAGIPAAVIDRQGYLRTAPHLHGLEAFFGAVLERTGL